MRQRVMIAMAIALEPAGADRRRADHRARRDRAGADDGPARRPAARDRDGPDPDHPRPRRGRRRRRPDRGHVRRADRRGGRRQRRSTRARRTRTPRACSSRSRAWTRRASELEAIKGLPPNLTSLPSGCAFHPRCPAGAGPLQGRRSRRSYDVAPGRGQRLPLLGGGPRRWHQLTEVVLEVRDLVKHFPLTQGIVFQRRSVRSGGRRRELRPAPRRDPRPGRRVRLRQVDLAKLLMGLERPTSGQRLVRGQRHLHASRATTSAGCAARSRSSCRTRTPR